MTNFYFFLLPRARTGRPAPVPAAAAILLFCALASPLRADNVTTAPAASASGAAADSVETTAAATAHSSDEISTATLDRRLLARLIVGHTNDERKKAGLKPLEPDESLQRVARKHSLDMATRGYFSHTSEREDRPDIPFEERVSLEKLGFRRTGENIALQPVVVSREIRTVTSSSGETTRDVTRNIATYEDLARKTVEGWMKSKGHRENILTPEFNRIGIGTAAGQRDNAPYLWITQNFGQK